MWENKLTRLLKVTYPIIQAPMAGGPTSPSLVAAVSNSGGLGMIGAGYMNAEQIRQQIREVRMLTDRSFGINLFIPSAYSLNPYKLQSANTSLQPFLEKFHLEQPISFPKYEQDLETFNQQLEVIMEEKVPVCSFTFGLPSPETISKLKNHSIVPIGTATTVKEAMMNEQVGMEAVVVQGTEAGGHRGTFEGDMEKSLIGLMSLIPQTADKVKIPIIAAGGIMDGRGILAAQCLGAIGVQMGTAFLVTKESGANTAHKEAVLTASEDKLVLTKSFSGKLARGITNDFIEKMKEKEEELPDYPIQNELTKGIRKASAEKRNPEFMSLWSGQSPRLAKRVTVQELMNILIQQVEEIRLKNRL